MSDDKAVSLTGQTRQAAGRHSGLAILILLLHKFSKRKTSSDKPLGTETTLTQIAGHKPLISIERATHSEAPSALLGVLIPQFSKLHKHSMSH